MESTKCLQQTNEAHLYFVLSPGLLYANKPDQEIWYGWNWYRGTREKKFLRMLHENIWVSRVFPCL